MYEVPRGFTHCDECEGGRIDASSPTERGPCGYWVRCPTCRGSGLLPTEELFDDAYHALMDGVLVSSSDAHLAVDAVLQTVAEHIGGAR